MALYDIGDYEASLNKALELSDYEGFAARKASAAAKGAEGIGLSCYIEACGLAPSQVAGAWAGVGLWESGEVRVNPTGSVSVLTGSHSHGQGHEQHLRNWSLINWASQLMMWTLFTETPGNLILGWARMARVACRGRVGIVNAADKVIEKGRKVAAHLLRTEPDNIEFEAPVYRMKNAMSPRRFKKLLRPTSITTIRMISSLG